MTARPGYTTTTLEPRLERLAAGNVSSQELVIAHSSAQAPLQWSTLVPLDSCLSVLAISDNGIVLLNHQAGCDTMPIVGWSSLYSERALDRLHIQRSEWQNDMVVCESDATRAAKGKLHAGCNFGNGTFKTPECVAHQAQGKKCGTMLAATPEWDAGRLQEVSTNLRVALEIVWLGSTANIRKLVSSRSPSRAKSAPRSLRRALLMPQVNPGSLYRCGKRT